MNTSDSSTDFLMGQVTAEGVTCAVCQHEVPISEAVVPEATDYLIYLCGLDCYQSWLGASGDRLYSKRSDVK